jgi:hypothetical protein
VGVAADRRPYLDISAYIRHEWLNTLPVALVALLTRLGKKPRMLPS